jgi:hypothetical protein
MTEMPVILCEDWSDAQVKAFRLLVNRSVNWAARDVELLTLEMMDLQGFGPCWPAQARHGIFVG